ncbi:MAG: PHP domain-containing protein [Eubacteriales bacterium]|nr:PHP domain-containing protein [Eubacteriales bacterium]
MIDLHLHTYYSDGTLSPEALVKRAARRGITTIAVTDHDGVNGISEALEAGNKYGVKVIPSIEFSTGIGNEDQQIYMHILGYHIDINNEPLKRAVEEIRKKREERNTKLLRTLNKIGFQMDKEDLLQRPEQDYVGKPNFALAMTKRGYINNPKDAFTPGKFLRHPEIRRIHREKIHVREAISLINGAGGKAVLAHPYKIAFLKCKNEGYYERLERLLDSLQEWGLSGMECYYSSHTPEQAEKLVEIAKRRGLLITSGSDFHGPDFNPALDIGVTGEVF